MLQILRHVETSRGKAVEQVVCDHGKREVNENVDHSAGKALKRDTRYQREKKRKQYRRRTAIELIIGHLRSDFRMTGNYLKGASSGDHINLLMTALLPGI